MSESKTGYPSHDRPWERYYSQHSLSFDFPKSTLYQCIFENNSGHLNRIAIEYFGRKILFKELFEQIDIAAKALISIGIKAGDIITIAMPTTPETVYLLYAISKIGAVANMIDPRTSKDGIFDYAKEAHSELFITIDLCYPKIKDIISDTSIKKIITISAADSLEGSIRMAYKAKELCEQIVGKTTRIIETDNVMKWNSFIKLAENSSDYPENRDGNLPVVILHTGGTTGIPKGVVLSSTCFNTIAYQYKLSGMHIFPGQRFLDIMPPFIAYGVGAGLHLPFVTGMTSVLIPKFESKNFAKMIKKLQPNHMAGVPSHWGDVLGSKELDGTDLSFLITPAVGGDAMDLKLERNANEFLAEHNTANKVIKGYGMTEQCSLATACINEINAEGSVGIPLPQNIISIFDPETGDELKYNQCGEVCISGPSTMLGYFNNKQATEDILRTHKDGRIWIHSGDLGHMTENGMLYIHGRIKRMIIRYDGFKVFPSQIEKVIMTDDCILSCCVVGIQDKEHAQGKLPAVFAVACDNNNSDEIISIVKKKCEEELPEYAQPTKVFIIDKMPLTSIGKVDFRALEEIAEKRS